MFFTLLAARLRVHELHKNVECFYFFLGVMPHVMRRSYSPFPVAGATLMIILKRKI